MTEMHVVYGGELRTRGRHVPSGSEVETDAPPDNEGRGERFSPTDLVAMSVASCLMTIMGIVARRRGFSIEGARARVEKHMASAPVRRIGRVVVEVALPAGVPPAERSSLEAAARVCPVMRSLSPEVAVELAFRYGGQA